MEEQLISFETAKLAKEKGFKVKCNLYYSKSGAIKQRAIKEVRIEAPTQSFLQKWLREEHKLEICVFKAVTRSEEYYITMLSDFNSGYMDFKYIEEGVFIVDQKYFTDFPSYEEALEKGLYEALKLI